MKRLVRIGDFMWVDPAAVACVYKPPGLPVTMVVGSQPVHFPSYLTISEVIEMLGVATGAAAVRHLSSLANPDQPVCGAEAREGDEITLSRVDATCSLCLSGA